MAALTPVLSGIRVHEATLLRDGTILRTEFGIHIGTRPATVLELAREEARYLVRQGMADILTWLGQEVGPPPPPASGRGRAILDRLTTITQ